MPDCYEIPTAWLFTRCSLFVNLWADSGAPA